MRAVIQVESNGGGYSKKTGRILIQFEPYWFRQFLPANVTQQLTTITRLNQEEKSLSQVQATLARNWTTAMSNRVEDQVKEYVAFSAAFAIHADAAMKATSWGLGQVMGHHFANLGFKHVGEFIDYCKISEAHQLDMMMRFINENKALDKAIRIKDWDTFAYRYNGKNYKGDPTTYKDDYDYKLRQAYALFSAQQEWR